MKDELNAYFRILEKFVLRAQSPTTGLIGDGKVGKIYSKLLKKWSNNTGVNIKQQIIKDFGIVHAMVLLRLLIFAEDYTKKQV